MSKVNELRRKATQAIRAKKWDDAAKLYERICDLDGSNASFRNELGDIHLKKGDVDEALACFQRAAELYTAVGLTNNSVAVLKKILRHDSGHLDSHWALGETRRHQGLDTDAIVHYLEFLDQSPSVGDGTRQSFLDRCGELLDRYSYDPQILSKLESIYVEWKLKDDQARLMVVKARLAHEAGQGEMVDKYVERARELDPDLEATSEYDKLQRALRGEGSDDDSDDAIELDPAEVAEDLNQISAELELDGFGGGLDGEADTGPTTAEIDLGFDLEMDAGGDSDDDALDLTADAESDPEPIAEPEPDAAEAPTEEPDAEAPGSVDLLDEILADGGFDLDAAAQEQVDSIASDVQDQIGGNVAEDDHQGQYDLGVVYVDMGLFDQALEAFDRAAQGEEFQLTALEMKGNCLKRVGRFDDAVACFQEGLGIPGYPSRIYQGLLFEVAECLEALQRVDEARDYYERVAAVDADFPRVQERLANLAQTQG